MLKSPLTSVLKVTYVVIGISDESIELFSLNNEGVITRLDNTAFRCYGTSSVDVVTSDHANRDTSSLALFYGVWYLGSDRVLDSNHTDAGHVVNNLLFFVPVGLGVNFDLKIRAKIISSSIFALYPKYFHGPIKGQQ